MTANEPVDFAVWLNAPKERTAPYFPTYSTISRTIQRTLRQWVSEWLYSHPEMLMHPRKLYPLLVYMCSRPYEGPHTYTFTYDIQQAQTVQKACDSAIPCVKRELGKLDLSTLPWNVRQRLFPYRYKELVGFVRQKPSVLCCMLHAETAIVEAILKLGTTDISQVGLDKAISRAIRSLSVQLNRLSKEFDFSGRAEGLLRIATEQLLKALTEAR